MGGNPSNRKCVAVGIILLFIGAGVIPSTGMVLLFDDDTTPPVTTCSFDPAEPDGENGWYVGSVTVFLNATDDDSGVNVTNYRVDCASWETYTEPFLLEKQGAGVVIEYYSVDNAGNVEPVKNRSIDRDTTKPIMDLYYNLIGNCFGWFIIPTVTARDDHSGMNRVEFYFGFGQYPYETVLGSGPTYETVYPDKYRVKGFIRDTVITDDYMILYSLLVSVSSVPKKWTIDDFGGYLCAYAYDNAGNWEYKEIEQPCFPLSGIHYSPGLYLFKQMLLPHNYTGYIGRYFIDATFSTRSSW
jgi:hypothetical protein